MVEGQYYTDQEKVYHDGLTSIAQSGRRVVYSGCLVEAQAVPEMTVLVNEGIVYFGTQIVGVNSSTNLVIPAAHATYNRYDIVVVNSTGTVSLLSGTPKSESDGYGPVPPEFDADTYLVLARITVENSTSTISSTDIKDLRALGYNTGSGGGIGSYNISFTSETSKVVTHNLNDPIPIFECWDSNDAYFVPSAITKVDDNISYVEFGSTKTGRIAVHGGIFNNVNVTQARDEVTITDDTCNIYTHSFAVKPIVQFVDDSGVVQNSGYTVDHISDNTVYTEFSPQTSGILILCGGAFGEIKSTRRYQLQMVQSDITYAPIRGQIGNTPTIDMQQGQTSGILFDFIPSYDTDVSEDIELEMQYCMDDTTSGTVIMQLDINDYVDADTVTSTIETSFVETITVPTTVNEFDIHRFSTIKIPHSYVATNKIICLELWRKNVDTNSSKIRIMNLDLISRTT